MRARLREIAEAAHTDPKQALLDSVGDTSGLEMYHNLILVATYIRPEKTKGGIFLADRSLAEDRFQSKVGLVLSLGPLAFKDDSAVKFGGLSVSPGDWILYRASDGWEMFFAHRNGSDGTPCRILEDVHVKGRVTDPALLW